MSTVTEETPTRAAPEAVDTEALLAPLGGAGGAGENAKDTVEYDAVAREVRAARAAGVMLPGDSGPERKGANWAKVEDEAAEILRAKSKDIQVCVWLTEALVNNHGFAGLRDGLRVMWGLHERFWETLYPEIYRGDEEPDEEGNSPPPPPDEEALEGRVRVLEAMDRLLASALRTVPLTRSVLGAHSFDKFEYSSKFVIPEDLDSLDEHDRRYFETQKAEGKITAEQWQKAKDATPPDFYKLQHALLGECAAEVASLKRVVDELYKDNGPRFAELEKTLEQIASAVRAILKEKGYDPDGKGGGAPAAGDNGSAASGGAASTSSGTTGSRADALRKLQEVADFFRRTEPHSPVSYLVQRAVKWGNMPLDAWLREVLKSDAELAQVRETLGLGEAPPADGGGDKNLDES